jgi:adenylylsulfate kinase-like enzyme
VIAIAAAISPYRASREELRSWIANFIEIYMTCPVGSSGGTRRQGTVEEGLCRRDPALHRYLRPYEPPAAPEVTIDSSTDSLEDSVAKILLVLGRRGIIALQRESVPVSSPQE